MSRTGRRALALVAGILVAGLLAWAFVEGREEMAREREREKPVTTPSRVSRSPSGEVLVEMDRQTRERVGVAVAPLASRTERVAVRAFGVALDPSSFLVLHAELSTAEAALVASRAEFERNRTLHREGENTSAKALEAATAQMHADEIRVQLARRQIASTWGDDVAHLESAERETLASRLATRGLVFVRASVPLGDRFAGAPLDARLVLPGAEDRPLSAASVRAAPSLDPAVQGRAFLLRVEPGDVPLLPGAAATVLLGTSGEARSGVVVPRASVVRLGGSAWVYVQVDDDHFARRPVSVDQPTGEGWFETVGLAPGNSVVVIGAQTLLSEEQKSQIQVGEEGH